VESSGPSGVWGHEGGTERMPSANMRIYRSSAADPRGSGHMSQNDRGKVEAAVRHQAEIGRSSSPGEARIPSLPAEAITSVQCCRPPWIRWSSTWAWSWAP
jgi:hypothetical protein